MSKPTFLENYFTMSSAESLPSMLHVHVALFNLRGMAAAGNFPLFCTRETTFVTSLACDSALHDVQAKAFNFRWLII